jgi:hypothetical protein
MQIERRQRRAARYDLGDPGTAPHQAGERRWTLDHHRGASRHHQRCVANELQAITQALFGMEQ